MGVSEKWLVDQPGDLRDECVRKVFGLQGVSERWLVYQTGVSEKWIARLVCVRNVVGLQGSYVIMVDGSGGHRYEKVNDYFAAIICC